MRSAAKAHSGGIEIRNATVVDGHFTSMNISECGTLCISCQRVGVERCGLSIVTVLRKEVGYLQR